MPYSIGSGFTRYTVGPSVRDVFGENEKIVFIIKLFAEYPAPKRSRDAFRLLSNGDIFFSTVVKNHFSGYRFLSMKNMKLCEKKYQRLSECVLEKRGSCEATSKTVKKNK
uniref:Uncharacterized protein n=1 Tax=Schizaphis graminum TaxID=13262 RepID=A0A2S2NUK6_SCHGA